MQNIREDALADTNPVLGLALPVARIRLRAPQRHTALSIGDIATFAGHTGRVREVRVLAEELLRAGFLDAPVVPDALEATVAGMADALATSAPVAVQGMEASPDACTRGDPEADALARSGFVASLRSADLLEGLRAMREKRRPAFTGR